MAVKFYADNYNARLVWGWTDGEYTTEDAVEIEKLAGLGLRREEVSDKKEETGTPNEGTVAWLKAELDAKGVNYDGITKKADLQELLDMKNDEE